MKQSQRFNKLHHRNPQGPSTTHKIAALGLMSVVVHNLQPMTCAQAAVQNQQILQREIQSSNDQQLLKVQQQHKNTGHASNTTNSKQKGKDVDTSSSSYQNAIAKTLALMKKKQSGGSGLPSLDSTESLTQSTMPAVSVENLDKSNTTPNNKDSQITETKKSPDTLAEDPTTQKQQLSQSTTSAASEEKASISEVAAALSGNETSLELKNGKLVSDDKASSSMAFTQYSDSQSKAFIKKQSKATQKEKDEAKAAKKDDAKSKKMYDNALTSRTIMPADPDDELGAAGVDSIKVRADVIKTATKEDASLLSGLKVVKPKTTQSLVQSTQKEQADVAASTGIDESLIQSLMKQNPSLDAAAAAQLAQSMIEKEIGGGSQQASESLSQQSSPAPIPISSSPTPLQPPAPEEPIKAVKQTPELQQDVTKSIVEQQDNQPKQSKESLVQSILKQMQQKKKSRSTSSADSLTQASDTKPILQDKTEQTSKAEDTQNKAAEVSIITEKPIDTSQYASQMADSLIKPLQLQEDMKKEDSSKPVELSKELSKKLKLPKIVPNKQNKTNSASKVKSQRLQQLIEKAKKAKIAQKTKDKIAQLAAQKLKQKKQQQAKAKREQELKKQIKMRSKTVEQKQVVEQKSEAKVQALEENKEEVKTDKSQEVVKQEKQAQPKVEEKTQAEAPKSEPKAEPAAQKSEKPSQKVEQPAQKANSKKEQGAEEVDDHKLAVKHTIALVKAQKLHQDLLQFNKLLIHKDGDAQPTTPQKSSEGEKQEPKVEAQASESAEPKKEEQKEAEEQKKSNLIASISNSLAQSLKKVQAVAQTGSTGQKDDSSEAGTDSLLQNGDLRTKLSPEKEAQRVLDESNRITVKAKETQHIVEAKPVEKPELKSDSTKQQNVTTKVIKAKVKANEKKEADESASEAAKLSNNDMTMHKQEVHAGKEVDVKKLQGKAEVKKSKTQTLKLKPIHLTLIKGGKKELKKAPKTEAQGSKSGVQDIIAKTLALAKKKQRRPPGASMLVQLDSSNLNRASETTKHKGGISNTSTHKQTNQAQASSKSKSKFIDGWDENKNEFTSKEDKREEGALVMKTTFSMHEVNGGSLGEKPTDQEIESTLNQSFSKKKSQAPQNLHKKRTVQKHASNLQETSDDGGESLAPSRHKSHKKEANKENTANNSSDTPPKSDQGDEVVSKALKELNSKAKPFSKDIPKIHEEQNDILSYSASVDKKDESKSNDSQQSVSELMSAKANEESKHENKPASKPKQSKQSLSQNHSKEHDDERDKDDGHEERYLERLKVRDGDKEVAHEQSQPLSVYDTSNPDIEEVDGHVESTMEREKEFEKANVDKYLRMKKKRQEEEHSESKQSKKEYKKASKAHHRAQKGKKSSLDEDDEEEHGEVGDDGDYSKEVKEKNVDAFKQTEKRNREAISYEHHEESEPTDKLKERDSREEREKQVEEVMKEHEEAVKREKKHDDGDYRPEVNKANHDTFKTTKRRNDEAVTEDTVKEESEPIDHKKEQEKLEQNEKEEKERMKMRDEYKSEGHKPEGYGEEVKKINEDTFDETEKRNGEAIGSYTQTKHKHHQTLDEVLDRNVEDSYKEIADRNADALEEHFKPSESHDDKKSEDQDKKEEGSHKEEKTEEKEEAPKKKVPSEQKEEVKPKEAKPKVSEKEKKQNIQDNIKAMKKSLDTFHLSSKKEEKQEEAPRVDAKQIDEIAKKADSMEKVVEEELKGLTSELKKKEQAEDEKKDESSSEPANESKDEDNSVSELSKQKKDQLESFKKSPKKAPESPKVEFAKKDDTFESALKKESTEDKEDKAIKEKNQEERSKKDYEEQTKKMREEEKKLNDKDEEKGAEKEKQFEAKVAHLQKNAPKPKQQDTKQDSQSDKKKRQMEQLYGKRADKKTAMKEIESAKDQIRKALQELEAQGDHKDSGKDKSQGDKQEVIKGAEFTNDVDTLVKSKSKEDNEFSKKKKQKAVDDLKEQHKKERRERAHKRAEEKRAAHEKKISEEKKKQEQAAQKEKLADEKVKKLQEEQAKKEKEEKEAQEKQEKAKKEIEEQAKTIKEEQNKIKEIELDRKNKKEKIRNSQKPEFAKKGNSDEDEIAKKDEATANRKASVEQQKQQENSLKSKVQDNIKNESDLQKKIGSVIESKLKDKKNDDGQNLEKQKEDKKELKQEDKKEQKRKPQLEQPKPEPPKPEPPKPEPPKSDIKQQQPHKKEHVQSKELLERKQKIQDQVAKRLKEEHRDGMIFGIPNPFEHVWAGVKWVFGIH